MDQYEFKYLKYKNKYLELKKLGGGLFGKTKKNIDNQETIKLKEKYNILLKLLKFTYEYDINNQENQNIMNSLKINFDIKEFNKYDYSKSMDTLFHYINLLSLAMFYLNNGIKKNELDNIVLLFLTEEIKKTYILFSYNYG
jgi:hypothetical protein